MHPRARLLPPVLSLELSSSKGRTSDTELVRELERKADEGEEELRLQREEEVSVVGMDSGGGLGLVAAEREAKKNGFLARGIVPRTPIL